MMLKMERGENEKGKKMVGRSLRRLSNTEAKKGERLHDSKNEGLIAAFIFVEISFLKDDITR